MSGRRALVHTAGLLAGLGGLLWAAVLPHQPLVARWFAAPIARAVRSSPVVRRHVSTRPRPVTVVPRVSVDTPPPPFVASYARPLPGPPPQPVPPEPPDTEKAFNSVMADTTPQAVLIDLQINGLVAATVQAYRVRTEVLLPLAQLLSLAEVRYRLSPNGVLEATVEPGSKKLLVAANRDTMMFGDRRVRIEREFRLYRDGELFVGAERLGNLCGTRIVVSWSELTAIVMDPSIFPVGQRVKRESARDGLRRRQGRAPADMTLGLERRNADGLVLDYSGFLPGGQSIGAAAYTVGLGAPVFGGSLALGLHSVGRADAGVVQGDGSWTGVWEDNPWVRQVRIGDGYSTGPRLQLLRGASITNAPFMRSPLIGTSRYLGRLEPGWSVEAYQNGQLIAFDTTDAGGRFGFDLPVRYGENPVDFVAYGPLGDVRQFDRTYRVLGQLLPAGRFEYGLSGGSCRANRCTATGNLDLRYGLTPRVTLEGGADRFWRDSLPSLFHPYALVTANPTNDWAVEFEGVAHALARASVQFEPSIDLHVQAQAEAFDSRTADPLLIAPGQRSLWGLSGFYRPLPGYGFFYLEGSLSQLRTVAMGTTTRARLGASVQADEARFLPYVRIERQSGAAGGTTTTRPFVGVSTFLLPRPHWGKLLSSTFFRSTLEAQVGDGPAKVTQTSLYASRPLWSGVSLDAGVVWQRGALFLGAILA